MLFIGYNNHHKTDVSESMVNGEKKQQHGLVQSYFFEKKSLSYFSLEYLDILLNTNYQNRLKIRPTLQPVLKLIVEHLCNVFYNDDYSTTTTSTTSFKKKKKGK